MACSAHYRDGRKLCQHDVVGCSSRVLTLAAADGGDWPESLSLRPANDGRLCSAADFQAYYGATAMEHWITAGLRLREFQFVFEAVPDSAYTLDAADVPAPI